MQRTYLLFLFFLSGLSGLIYEIAWVRQASLTFGVSLYAYSAVLAAYMIGLALGNYWLGRKADQGGRPLRTYAGLEGQALEDAWTFVKFLVREDNARSYMKASNTPPTQKKLQEEWFGQFGCMDPAKVKEVYQGAFAHGRESSNHLLVRWDELNQIWGNALTPYFDDPNGDTKATLTQIEQDLTDALQRIAKEEGP